MSGADIQLEGGNWTKVHNTILEALAKAPLNGSEFRCVMALFRLTYGWKKKEERISYQEWAAETNLDRRSVIRALQQLVDKHILYRHDNGNNRPATWGFNKYIEQWFTTSDQSDTSCGDQIDTRAAPSGDQSDTTSSDEIDTKTSDQSDTPYKEKKEKERNLPTAGWRVPDFSDKVGDFVQAYQDIWGVMIHGEYIRDSIIEWADRVTLAGWEYALKQCVRRGKRQQWGYLEGILRRIESEGFEEQTPLQESGTLDFSLDEVLI